MDKKTQQIVGAGAAVLVLIAGFMLVHKKPATKVITDAAGTSTEQAAVVDATATATEVAYTTGLPEAKNIKANSVEGLKVADQASGETVAIDGLNLDATTWVVVYEADDAGQPGRILGAGLAWPGSATFAAPLMRKTETGKTYFVALIKDDGSKKFDLRKLRPAQDGEVVSFKAI